MDQRLKSLLILAACTTIGAACSSEDSDGEGSGTGGGTNAGSGGTNSGSGSSPGSGGMGGGANTGGDPNSGSGGNNTGGGSPAPTYSLSGSVTGVVGTGLRLRLSPGGEQINVAAGDDSFSFDAELDDETSYRARIVQNANNQHCTLTNGEGTIAAAPVSDLEVSCADVNYESLFASTTDIVDTDDNDTGDESITGIYQPGIDSADINGDGMVDFLLAGYAPAPIDASVSRVYLNQGGGIFEEWTTPLDTDVTPGGDAVLPPVGVYPDISFGLIDTDENVDLLISGIGNSNEKVTQLYRGQGDDGFVGVPAPWDNGAADVPLTPTAGFAGLGVLRDEAPMDIFTVGLGNGNGRTTSYYRSADELTWEKDIQLVDTDDDLLADEELPPMTGYFDSADLNGDGMLDFTMNGSLGAGTLQSIYLARAEGVFEEFENVVDTDDDDLGDAPLPTGQPRFADLNGDGIQDLLVGSVLFFGVTPTVFRQVPLPVDTTGNAMGDTALSTIATLGLGDVDGDGDIDLIRNGWTGSARLAELLINNRDGTFTVETPANFIPMSDAMAEVFDHNGDGRPDVLFSGRSDGLTYVTFLLTNQLAD